MASTTPNYGWTLPVVGGDTDAWGTELNNDITGIDSTVFTVSGVANAALPKAGGALTGPLTGTSATFSGAVSAASISAPQAIGDNRLINGDMRIDQRNNGASGTAVGYTVDRWRYDASQTGKGSWQQTSGLTFGPFATALRFTSSSAYTLVAADSFFFDQLIEADMVTDFQWGLTGAQSVTLSFWAWCSLTGTFGGSIRNNGATRSYPFSYSLPTASTWTKIAITIPGDTAGTWTLSGNGVGVTVNFSLGAGATYSGSTGAWAATNYVSVPGAVSVVSTNNATFYVTGVKLEIGSVATPFNRQSLTKSLADCQRYFEMSYGQGNSIGSTGANGTVYFYNQQPSSTSGSGCTVFFKVEKRAGPTITVYSSATGAAGKVRDIQNNADVNANIYNNGPTAFNLQANPSVATTVINMTAHWTASAEL